MDVKSFYKGRGLSAGDSASSLSHARRLHTIRQLDPHTLWRTFPKQQMAFDFAKTCWQSAVVFAYESEEFGLEGQRKYLVTTYQYFSQRYLAMEPPRHYYEIIPEGAVCRLYFDIEYKFELNPELNALSTLETFIEYVCYQLKSCFQLSCSRSNVLDLDSTTETKFSRHLIFHLPNTVFINNIHIGKWVHCICDELRGLRREIDGGMDPREVWQTHFFSLTHPPCPSVERLLTLFVSTDRGDIILICDEGVYTRNRNFRLFLSSKLGKKKYLKLAKENQFKVVRQRNTNRKNYMTDVFLNSLVCSVSFESSSRILSYDPAGSGEEEERKGRKRRRYGDGAVGVSTTSSESVLTPASSGEGAWTSSPHPLVDSFITSCINRGGVQGAIRQWSYFNQERLLVYDIKHNRWCDNIQRAHKSNNIMIVADLQRGVYYQKCHDPVCKSTNFKSIEREIPKEVNPYYWSEPQPVSGGRGEGEEVRRDTSCGEEGCGDDNGIIEWLGPGEISLDDIEDYSLEDEGDGEVEGKGERKKEEKQMDEKEVEEEKKDEWGKKERKTQGKNEEKEEEVEENQEDVKCKDSDYNSLDDETIVERVAAEMDLSFPSIKPPTPTDDNTTSTTQSRFMMSSQEQDSLFIAAYDAFADD